MDWLNTIERESCNILSKGVCNTFKGGKVTYAIQEKAKVAADGINGIELRLHMQMMLGILL